MEFTSLSSITTHYYSYPYSSSPTFSLSLFSLSSHNSELPSTSSSSSSSSSQFQRNLRRPKPLKNPTSKPPHKPTSNNPLKSLRISQNTPHPNLTHKLRLTSKISPPPPQNDVVFGVAIDDDVEEESDDDEVEEDRVSEKVEFRQEGKIFVGNLPLWIKKPEITEFFRQFGPIKSVVLIKGHEDVERNMGFGFVIYGGAAAEKSAMKAVEFDGVEFHGRVLTVKLDDGRRLKAVAEERKRWVEGGEDGREYRSEWHEERDGSRREFRKVLDSQPDNWQAVVRAFETVKKVCNEQVQLYNNIEYEYESSKGKKATAHVTWQVNKEERK